MELRSGAPPRSSAPERPGAPQGASGAPGAPEELPEGRQAVPDRHLFIGSGATESNIASLLETADGAIVGSSLKIDDDIARGIDPEKARAWILAARG